MVLGDKKYRILRLKFRRMLREMEDKIKAYYVHAGCQ